MVGDTTSEATAMVAYEVLCRTHYRSRTTASRSQREHMSAQPLPFAR
jgi:hypothetical protein